MFVQDPRCFEFMHGELAPPVRYKSFSNVTNVPDGDETPCVEVFVHAFQSGTWEIIVSHGTHVEYGMGSTFKKDTQTKYNGDSYATCAHRLKAVLIEYPICNVSLENVVYGLETAHKLTCMPLHFWREYVNGRVNIA